MLMVFTFLSTSRRINKLLHKGGHTEQLSVVHLFGAKDLLSKALVTFAHQCDVSEHSHTKSTAAKPKTQYIGPPELALKGPRKGKQHPGNVTAVPAIPS